ncbi:hypothetical protein BHE74_00028267 [Ensete ventricosum]|nr:hypothetical protein BHE74_00028267 [Ensete ventricosum]
MGSTILSLASHPQPTCCCRRRRLRPPNHWADVARISGVPTFSTSSITVSKPSGRHRLSCYALLQDDAPQEGQQQQQQDPPTQLPVGVGAAVEERPAESISKDPLQSLKQDGEQNSVYNFLYPSKELLPDDKEMSIFDHLEELRQRIFISVLAVGAAILGCFVFSKDLILLLEEPVSSQGVRFLQLSPGEFFFTTIKVKFFLYGFMFRD